MPPDALRSYRHALLLGFALFSLLLIVDQSADNHFTIHALNLDINNYWIGGLALVSIFLAWRRYPAFWRLYYYFIPPIAVFIQRSVMIALDPNRADLALGVYFLVLYPLWRLTRWTWQHGITDTQ